LEFSPEILIHYLENPEVLNASSNQAITDMIEKYPFFQTARLLRIKNLQKIYQTVGKDELHLTAAYVTDRKVLYYLLCKFSPGVQDVTDSRGFPGKQVSLEKEYKDSLKENIAETLDKQLHYYELEPEHEIELIPGLAIDVRKEYGSGIELDDSNFSIGIRRQISPKDIFELTGEPETDFSPDQEAEPAIRKSPIDDSFELKEAEFFQVDEPIPEFNTDGSEATETTINLETTPELINIDSSSPDSEISFDNLPIPDTPKDLDLAGQQTDKTVSNWRESADSKSFNEWLELVDESEPMAKENSGKNISEGTVLPEETDTAKEIPLGTGYKLLSNKDDESSDNQRKKEKNDSLIDIFIKTNPKIVPARTSGENEDISSESVREHESFFTDTLAQIYVKQGNYAKAILAYEKLSLKYPEKSTYFAGQIAEIKKHINKS
jgi:hypothetical protein